jgi:hypothetical protein
MAKNDAAVQIAKIVPISWLHDYLDMLRTMRAAQPAPGLDEAALQRIKTMDAALDIRIHEVSAYLTRLNPSVVIN